MVHYKTYHNEQYTKTPIFAHWCFLFWKRVWLQYPWLISTFTLCQGFCVKKSEGLENKY